MTNNNLIKFSLACLIVVSGAGMSTVHAQMSLQTTGKPTPSMKVGSRRADGGDKCECCAY